MKIAIGCQIAEVDLLVSVSDSCKLESMLESFASAWTHESGDAFQSRCSKLESGSLSLLGAKAGDELHAVLSERNIPIFGAPLSNGRIQLLSLLREQSVSETVHRYGNIV